MEVKEIIHKMHVFQHIHRNELRRIMESEGLYYGQLPILEYVKKNGRCTQKEIADYLQVSPPSIATSVKRLVKRGYLSKTIDENDQRATLIELTEAGAALSETCRIQFDALDERIFAQVSEVERQQLYDLLCFLIENVKKEGIDHD